MRYRGSATAATSAPKAQVPGAPRRQNRGAATKFDTRMMRSLDHREPRIKILPEKNACEAPKQSGALGGIPYSDTPFFVLPPLLFYRRLLFKLIPTL